VVEDKLDARLAGSWYSAIRQLDWQFHEGEVLLRGTLPSYYLKQVAQALILSIPGVKTVLNSVEVLPRDQRDRRRPDVRNSSESDS
jgi:osmotically-inducible protein OsmY